MKTFFEFLLQEDLNGDIEALRLKISLLNAQKVKVTKPIDDQLGTAQKILATKINMLSREQKSPPTQPTPAQNPPVAA